MTSHYERRHSHSSLLLVAYMIHLRIMKQQCLKEKMHLIWNGTKISAADQTTVKRHYCVYVLDYFSCFLLLLLLLVVFLFATIQSFLSLTQKNSEGPQVGVCSALVD